MLQARFGDPRIAVAIMALPAMAMFFCGASCVTSNSRYPPLQPHLYFGLLLL